MMQVCHAEQFEFTIQVITCMPSCSSVLIWMPHLVFKGVVAPPSASSADLAPAHEQAQALGHICTVAKSVPVTNSAAHPCCICPAVAFSQATSSRLTSANRHDMQSSSVERPMCMTGLRVEGLNPIPCHAKSRPSLHPRKYSIYCDTSSWRPLTCMVLRMWASTPDLCLFHGAGLLLEQVQNVVGCLLDARLPGSCTALPGGCTAHMLLGLGTVGCMRMRLIHHCFDGHHLHAPVSLCTCTGQV